MARKSLAKIDPKAAQEGLEQAHTKHVRTVDKAESSTRGRLKNAQDVPSGDTPTKDIVDVISMTLEVNGEIVFPGVKAYSLPATCDNWARILAQAIRYGIPYDEFAGEGWHIRDDETLGDPPTCDDCAREEEEAA